MTRPGAARVGVVNPSCTSAIGLRRVQPGELSGAAHPGTLFKVGVQMSSIFIVIPYVADQFGSPAIVVALIVPSFTAGTLLGMIFGPRVLRIMVPVAGLLGGFALVNAALTALIAVDIAVVPPRFGAYPLLLLCVLIGIVSGSLEVVSPMAMSALLSGHQHSDLLLKQSGYAAALVVVITALFADRFVRESLPWSDVDLLWIGVVAMALCGHALSGCEPVGSSWRTDRANPRHRARRASLLAPIAGCSASQYQLVFHPGDSLAHVLRDIRGRTAGRGLRRYG